MCADDSAFKIKTVFGLDLFKKLDAIISQIHKIFDPTKYYASKPYL